MGIIKKGKDYYIRYNLYNSGKCVQKQEKIGQSKTLAEEVLRKRLQDRAEMKLLGIVKIKPITLSEFVPKYLEYSKNNKKFSMSESEYYSTKALLDHFGNIFLHQIDPLKIEEYKYIRLQTLKPASVNRELACLSKILNTAVEWKLLGKNPVGKIKTLKEPPGRVRFLLIEEITKLLEVCAVHLKLIIIFALFTGMRKGELLALEWKDIDLKNELIHVEKTMFRNKIFSTKNYSRRDLPLNSDLKQELKKIENKTGRIFGNIGDFKKAWHSSLKRAGIEDFHFHDLRHTFASHLVIAGESLYYVKELLGHKSILMTQKYAHLAPDAKKAAINRLSDIYKLPEK